MENSTIAYGIIGILLVGGLGVFFLTPDQLAKASTCTTNNVTAIFEKLSSTNVTGYWTVNGSLKQSVCRNGKWIPTIDWLKQNSLTEKDILVQEVKESDYTEDGAIIVEQSKPIIVDKNMKISVQGVVYDVSYTDKPPVIKCICDQKIGCQIAECLN